MMLPRNIAALFMLILLVSFAPKASAQYGMWGGTQPCPYGLQAGNGASSDLDTLRDATKKSKAKQKEVDKASKELEKLNKQLERARRDVEDVIDNNFSDTLFTHIENGMSCESYGNGKATCPPGADGCISGESGLSTGSYKQSEWKAICPANYSGMVNGNVACSLHRNIDGGGRSSVRECAEGLKTYASLYRKKAALAKKMERAKRDLEDENDRIDTAKSDFIDHVKDRAGGTEGGICWECIMGGGSGGGTFQYQRQPDYVGALTNGIVGGLAVYLGDRQNKQVAQANASIGWPTQNPYPAWGYGLPFLQNGLQALAGGTGRGTFGCAGGMNGGGMWNGSQGSAGPYGYGGTGGSPYGVGGPFGWPQSYMPPQASGGMYAPGFGPWGGNGPFGIPTSQGFPYAGGYPGAPQGFPGQFGQGYGQPGFGQGGMLPGQNPYGPGPSPFGIFGGGGSPYGGYGGSPFGSPYGGGYGGGVDMGQMAYQQQLMQMQMQQQQLYAGSQQRMATNYYQGQQVSQGLQQEMYSLQGRLAAVQSGSMYGGLGAMGGYGGIPGYGGYGGYSGYGGYGGGNYLNLGLSLGATTPMYYYGGGSSAVGGSGTILPVSTPSGR